MTKIFEIIFSIPVLCGMVFILALMATILACIVDMIVGSVAAIRRGKVLRLEDYEGTFMPYASLKKTLRVKSWLGILGRLGLLYGAAIVGTGIIAVATGLLYKRLFG